MSNSSNNMKVIYPDKFTLSLNRDTFICINMDRELGVLSIDEYVNKKQKSRKMGITQEEDFLHDFVTEKVKRGYIILKEGEGEMKPDEEVKPDFVEIEKNVGVKNENKVSIAEVTRKQSGLVKFYSFMSNSFSGALSMIRLRKFELIRYLDIYEGEIEDIMMKARALEVECVLEKENFRVTGCAKGVENFKLFLDRIEKQHIYKEYLYPKYWDFSIVERYSEITVDPSSEEFQEICELFQNGFKNGPENAKVTKLTRIQNLDLYKNYIETMCSRTEIDPYLPNLRKLLFHGTRGNKPSCIYKDSKIGFELERGQRDYRVGKGIHFAASSFYSHAFAHMTQPGKYQMLLADVFTGVSYDYENPWPILGSLHEEQDSFQLDNNVFVLPRNSQCYPLYLVDYRMKDMTRYSYSSSTRKQNNSRLNPYKLSPAGPLAMRPNTSLTPDIFCRKRVQKEFDEIKQDAWLSNNFFVEKVDIIGCIEWTISLIGFEDTPYEGGLFKITIIFPSDYPNKPPYVKFQTKIYHPSIDDMGIVCLGLLLNWSPTSEIRHVLLTISCMMHDPMIEEPLMPEIREVFERNRREFTKTARSWTEKYAPLD